LRFLVPPLFFALAGGPLGMLCFPRALAARSAPPRFAPETALFLGGSGARAGAAAGRLAGRLAGLADGAAAGRLAGLGACGVARPRSAVEDGLATAAGLVAGFALATLEVALGALGFAPA
jgi:hypothetical protein